MDPTTYHEWKIGIISGVVSSVIASISIWIALRFWEDTIKPKLSAIKYRGPKIGGNWTNHLPEKPPFNVTGSMKLKQDGHHLNGKMELHVINGNKERISFFEIKGEIVNNFIRLHTIPLDSSTLTFSSGIFRILNDDKLIGSSIYIENEEHKISFHQEVIWTRGS